MRRQEQKVLPLLECIPTGKGSLLRRVQWSADIACTQFASVETIEHFNASYRSYDEFQFPGKLSPIYGKPFRKYVADIAFMMDDHENIRVMTALADAFCTAQNAECLVLKFIIIIGVPCAKGFNALWGNTRIMQCTRLKVCIDAMEESDAPAISFDPVTFLRSFPRIRKMSILFSNKYSMLSLTSSIERLFREIPTLVEFVAPNVTSKLGSNVFRTNTSFRRIQ
jgi:hypothetical protein